MARRLVGHDERSHRGRGPVERSHGEPARPGLQREEVPFLDPFGICGSGRDDCKIDGVRRRPLEPRHLARSRPAEKPRDIEPDTGVADDADPRVAQPLRSQGRRDAVRRRNGHRIYASARGLDEQAVLGQQLERPPDRRQRRAPSSSASSPVVRVPSRSGSSAGRSVRTAPPSRTTTACPCSSSSRSPSSTMRYQGARSGRSGTAGLSLRLLP